jgi:hypothetical protein
LAALGGAVDTTGNSISYPGTAGACPLTPLLGMLRMPAVAWDKVENLLNKSVVLKPFSIELRPDEVVPCMRTMPLDRMFLNGGKGYVKFEVDDFVVEPATRPAGAGGLDPAFRKNCQIEYYLPVTEQAKFPGLDEKLVARALDAARKQVQDAVPQCITGVLGSNVITSNRLETAAKAKVIERLGEKIPLSDAAVFENLKYDGFLQREPKDGQVYWISNPAHRDPVHVQRYFLGRLKDGGCTVSHLAGCEVHNPGTKKGEVAFLYDFWRVKSYDVGLATLPGICVRPGSKLYEEIEAHVNALHPALLQLCPKLRSDWKDVVVEGKYYY